jgi:hypothetical protein
MFFIFNDRRTHPPPHYFIFIFISIPCFIFAALRAAKSDDLRCFAPQVGASRSKSAFFAARSTTKIQNSKIPGGYGTELGGGGLAPSADPSYRRHYFIFISILFLFLFQ